MPFQKLRLIEPLLRAVRSEGYTIPTAIQDLAIPHVLEGKDLMGCAQTGTGKTAAFALPILQRLHNSHGAQHSHGASQTQHAHQAHHPAGGAAHAHDGAAHGRASHERPSHDRGGYDHAPAGYRPIRALILTPTRELAAQIADSFRVYGQHLGLRHTVIFGGVSQGPQSQALRRGVDIVVATPGRLLDLMTQRLVNLRQVEVFVLDEADRMLDMGFIHDIRRIIAQLPQKRQTLMFSATMPREIRTLSESILTSPVEVTVKAESPAADTVAQTLYHVDTSCKLALLEHLLLSPDITRALVFTRTKHGADRVAKRLCQCSIPAMAIHSNKSQNNRMRALASFKGGTTRVLVASDIAARGLDVDNISHVINYDLPNEAETYVHRIGRTGRAGASGQAISFASPDQRDELRDIERLLGRKIDVLQHSIKPAPGSAPEPRQRERSYHSRGGSGGGGGRHRPSSSSTPHKRQSPEQAKNTFWRSRRRLRPR